MKMKNFNKRLTILLAGLSIVGTTMFAGELNSLTHEVMLNDYDGGMEKTEWTLARGSYQINDSFKFIFDVDKDYTTATDGSKTEGWDTEFGLTQSGWEINDWDLSLTYKLRYDAAWDVDSTEKNSETALYILQPYFSKNVEFMGKSVNLGIELWAQVGGTIYESMQTSSVTKANFYASANLTDNWYVWSALYNSYLYDSVEDEYDYKIMTENYLNYTLPLAEKVSFYIENYFEAYYTPDSEAEEFYGHSEPMIKYNNKVNDNFSWHAAVSYELITIENSATGDTNWNNNELEVKAGFTFQ